MTYTIFLNQLVLFQIPVRKLLSLQLLTLFFF